METKPTSRISKNTFKAAMEKARDLGFNCLLPAASKRLGTPFHVRVRVLSLDEKAATNGITNEMQDEVWRRSRAYASWQVEMAEKRLSGQTSDLLEEVRDNPQLRSAVNVVCIAGFIEPRLTEDEAAADQDPDLWHVDSIPFSDRFHAFRAISEPESAEAKRLTLFRPEPKGDVSAQSVEPEAHTTERTAANDGAAVFAHTGGR